VERRQLPTTGAGGAGRARFEPGNCLFQIARGGGGIKSGGGRFGFSSRETGSYTFQM
jgi:hypothetical protein